MITPRLINLLTFTLVVSCGEDDGQGKKSARTPNTDGSSAQQNAGEANGDNATADGSAPSGTEGESPTNAEAALAFWSNTIKPAFEKDCSSCHAEPRFQVPKRGPLTIFTYDAMKAMLADGPSSVDNKLIRKVTAVDLHDGGKRCDVTQAPCSDIIQWRKLELGADPTGSGGDGAGGPVADASSGLVSVTSSGKIYGWAVNKADLNAKVNVKIYLDGLIGTGTLAATTKADKAGEDGNHPGDHHFFVQIPTSFSTGKDRDLYIYGDGDVLLSPTPFKLKSWTASTAGRTYFDNSIKAKITASCSSCHTASYDFFFPLLLSKGPNEGGTATNNYLINKPSTANGTSHSGGNRCGSINGSPCAEFQQWWNVEFGAR